MLFNTAVKVVSVNLLAVIFYTSSQVASSPYLNHQHWYTSPTINNVFTGNRILSSISRGSFPNEVEVIDVILPSDVKWLVATTLLTSYAQTTNEEEAQFVATTQDGLAYLISANGTVDQMVDYSISSDGSDVDQPPLVSTYIDEESSNQQITKITQLPNTNLSSLSCPTHVYESVYIYIDSSGDIVLYDLATGQILNELQDVSALLDGRIKEAPQNVFDMNSIDNDTKSKLFAVYGGSTSFSHCVLGDCIEGSTLIFIQVSKQQQSNNNSTYQMSIQRTITLPTNTVYEGLYPMFIQNGTSIVTTVANSSRGAWIRIYNVCTGEIISESNYLGWGWRHMLFYNNFAPLLDDPLYSLVDVLTPHVRKQLEFFDISYSSTMKLQTSTSKFTTHDIGWRNLDTGISGDLNGDGINEAILLDENLENLVNFQLVKNGSSDVSTEEVWRMELIGRLTSNIAALSYDGGIGLAAASGSKVRLWISPSTSSPRDDTGKEEATSSTTSATMSVISSSTTTPPELTTDSTTTSTDTSITTSSSTEIPYASNDIELDISTSTNTDEDQMAEPKNCGVQINNVATQSRRIPLLLWFLLYL